MTTLDDFSRLVANVYAAAVHPDLWDAVIRDVHQTLGGSSGGLVTAHGASWSIEDSTLPQEALTSYAEYFCERDVVMAVVDSGPVGAVRTAAEVLHPYRRSEIVQDWVRPNNMGDDGLFVRLTSGPSPSSLIVNARGEFATPERIRTLSHLTVHLQQALRIRDRLGALNRSNRDLVAALDTLGHAVAIIADDGTVATLNAPAEQLVRAGDGIAVAAGHLVATPDGGRARLQRAVHHALRGDKDGVRKSTTTLCARSVGKRPFTIHVLPLQHDDVTGAGALVLIVDPEADVEPDAARLRRTFGLTAGEAEVAVRVARGMTLRSTAEELSVSIATVRTHLQHVFAKTDTHRQAELVRLLLGLGR